MRRVRLPDSRELLVSDTVGFIDRLPQTLVAAFRATLEEVADADLLLHVIDASASIASATWRGAAACSWRSVPSDVPVLEVFNKCDSARRRRARAADGALSRRVERLGDQR